MKPKQALRLSERQMDALLELFHVQIVVGMATWITPELDLLDVDTWQILSALVAYGLVSKRSRFTRLRITEKGRLILARFK